MRNLLLFVVSCAFFCGSGERALALSNPYCKVVAEFNIPATAGAKLSDGLTDGTFSSIGFVPGAPGISEQDSSSAETRVNVWSVFRPCTEVELITGFGRWDPDPFCLTAGQVLAVCQNFKDLPRNEALIFLVKAASHRYEYIYVAQERGGLAAYELPLFRSGRFIKSEGRYIALILPEM